jgi:hypothetical protein
MRQFETYNFNYSGYNVRFFRHDENLAAIQVNVYNRNVDGHSLASFLPVSEENQNLSLKQLKDFFSGDVLDQIITKAENHFSLNLNLPENPPE